MPSLLVRVDIRMKENARNSCCGCASGTPDQLPFGTPHSHLGVPRYKSQLCFPSSFPVKCSLGEAAGDNHLNLCILPPCGRSGWSSGLLVLPWPSPAAMDICRGNQWAEALCLSHSAFPISKKLKKKTPKKCYRKLGIWRKQNLEVFSGEEDEGKAWSGWIQLTWGMLAAFSLHGQRSFSNLGTEAGKGRHLGSGAQCSSGRDFSASPQSALM